MPLTKVTPRKPGFLCSICLIRLPSKDEWSKHLLACGLEDMSKRKFECEFCDQAFGKKTILTRHIKRVHGDDRVKTATQDQGKEPEVETEICETTSQEKPLKESHCSCCKAVGREKVDVGTQTNFKIDDQKKRGHQKIIRVIRKYQENGENIEKFEEDTWFD
uniref:C2H2-type domain-containing protein n=1 Tax=Magallana gigas TaxID=29159 RepID=A0A8W8K9E7_MAGGI